MATNAASDPKYKIVTQNSHQTLTTENERAMGLDGDGAGGKSAYQIAVDNGFVGSEQEWLDSLQGESAALEFTVHPNDFRGAAGKRVVVPTHISPAGGQTVHPSVLYFEDGWNGYKYWMAHTPYPNSDDSHEDPNIAVSHDGNNWSVPEGLVNPLDDADSEPAFNSDTWLVMSPDNATMYCFWRTYDTGTPGAEERIYYRSSTDGVSWEPKVLSLSNDHAVRRLLSPAIVYDNEQWVMWAVDMVPTPNRLVRMTSPDLVSWTAPETCTVDSLPANKEPWHVSIRKIGNKFVGMLVDTTVGHSGNNDDIFLMTSDNGSSWVTGTGPVVPRSNQGSGEPQYDVNYQAAFVPVSLNGVLALDTWYSSKYEATKTWNIYRTKVLPLVSSSTQLQTEEERRIDLLQSQINAVHTTNPWLPYLVIDGFNRSGPALDNAETNQAWQGTFTLTNNAISPAANTNSRAYIQTGSANQWVSARMGPAVPENQWWIMARYNPANQTYFRLGFNAGVLCLQAITNGGYSSLMPRIPGFEPKTGMWLGLKVEGEGRVSCFVNGMLVYYTESTLITDTTYTYAGVQSDKTTAVFDQFLVYP